MIRDLGATPPNQRRHVSVASPYAEPPADPKDERVAAPVAPSEVAPAPHHRRFIALGAAVAATLSLAGLGTTVALASHTPVVSHPLAHGPQAFPWQNPAPFQNGVRPVKDDIGPVPRHVPTAPVTLHLGQPDGPEISPNMGGLSYDSFILMQEPNYFTPQNHQLINLYKQLDIKHLRLGGDTVDYMAASPTRAEIDNLFQFAQKVPGLKVVYSLRLLNGDPQSSAATAAYIWQHYPNQVESFAIGNEPNLMQWYHDSHIHNYETYMQRWIEFAKSVQQEAPGAPISGPDWAGHSNYNQPGRNAFLFNFVHDAEKAGIPLASVNTHDYVDGSPKKTAAIAVQDMLGAGANAHEATFDRVIAHPLEKQGLQVQMTEDNDELIGNHGASDGMAGALFTENNLFQLADGGVSHAYFHNLRFNTRTIYETPDGHFGVNPKAYAIEAFNRFAQGKATPVRIDNPDGVNLRAYAVTHNGHQVVALINDTYGPQAKTASVSLPRAGRVVRIEAPHDDVQADTGIKLTDAQAVGSTIEVPPASIAFVTL